MPRSCRSPRACGPRRWATLSARSTCSAGLGAAHGDRGGAAALDDPVRAAGQRQDHARPDRRRPCRRGVRGGERRERRPRRGAGGDRAGRSAGGPPAAAHDLLPRRDPPLQQGTAGHAAARGRGGARGADRRHDREPVLRGQLGAALALPQIYELLPLDATSRCAELLRRALAIRSAASRTRRRCRTTRSSSSRRAPGGDARAALQRARARARDRASGWAAGDARARRGRDADEGRALRQGRRQALRLHLGLDQVDARLGRRTPRSTTWR